MQNGDIVPPMITQLLIVILDQNTNVKLLKIFLRLNTMFYYCKFNVNARTNRKKRPLKIPYVAWTLNVLIRPHQCDTFRNKLQALKIKKGKFRPVDYRALSENDVSQVDGKLPQYDTIIHVRSSSSIYDFIAFTIVGVNYAGPFPIKDGKGKRCRIAKCFIATLPESKPILPTLLS